MSADLISGPKADKKAFVFGKGDTQVNSSVVDVEASAGNYDTMSNEVADKTLTADNVNVINNVITIGFDQSAGWIVADNFKLYYYGPNLAASDALPVGDMEADKWYYFDIVVGGSYNFICSNLSDIVYSTDGTILVENAGTISTTFDASPTDLGAGRYYVKSSSAQTFTVAAASYIYSVSEPNVNKNYIQPSQTVTVSFTVSTNDSGATLTQNYSGVTFDGAVINVTPGESGFTFTTPADLEACVEHTLYIPAEAIGYANGATYNAEKSITLNAVAIYDGVYYMYNTDTENYISRRGNYNTQARMDDWGLAFNVSTDANNNTKLQYFDSQLWLGDDGFCYGDCSNDRVRSFNVTKVTGGYKFLNTNNNKYLAVYDNQVVGDAEEGVNLQGTSNIWSLESTAAHVNNYSKNEDDQAAAAASAAGLSGISTKAALESQLASNYFAVPVAITGSKAEKYQVYPGSGKDDGPANYYSETVDGLKPGIYKLSVAAFQRAAGYDRVAAADGARSLIYLYAGDAKTQLKSVMEYGASEAYESYYENGGKYYPSNESSAYNALETGNYTNDVYVYVADAGEGTGSLEIGISNPTRLGGNFSTWAAYNNWSLTRYAPNSEKFYATASHSYVQEGNEVTITYDELLNIIPKPTISSSISGVTFNGGSVECTPTENGFTFIVPAVSAGSTYTLSIPEGAVCSGRTAAQSITLKTPDLFDGAYYLKQNDADKYISRGGDSNTEATLDNYGIAVRITTDAANVTHFTFVDNNKNLFGGSESIYTDKNESDLGNDAARARWTVAKSGEGYTLYNPLWSKYIAAGTGAESGKPAAVYSDAAYVWTFETPAAHATKMAALNDANAAAVATAAGLSATTAEGLKAIIEGEGWVGKSITLSNNYSTVAEKWQNFGTIIETQNLTDLENGIYKVTFHGFHRLLNNNSTYELYQNDIASSSTYLWAGDQQLPFPSVMADPSETAYTAGSNPNFVKDSNNYPNSMGAAGQAFDDGKYTIDLFVYVSEGTLSLGAEAPGKYSNDNWICYRDLSLTFYKEFTGDYTALNTAIQNAEGKTLGFETGEYAPYTNVAALTALAAAKTLYTAQNATSQQEINDVTTALTNATWTANTEEVNAVYNGDFSLSENDGAMAGWVTDHSAGLGGAYHARAFVLTSGQGNYDNLSVFGQGDGTRSCGYFRFDGTNSTKDTKYTYGGTAGYTMPLKSNTIYKLTAQVGGWGQVDHTFQMAVVNSSDANVIAQNLKTPNTGVNSDGPVIDYEMYFVVPSNGDYKLIFTNTSGVDNAVVVSNIELFSTAALVFADGSVPTYAPGTYPTVKISRTLTAGNWATAVYPFAVSGVDKIAVLDSYEDGKLNFISATSSEANKPFMMRSNTDKSEITLNNVEVSAAVAVDVEKNGASLKGVYTTTTVNAAESGINYVLQGNKIWSIGEKSATVAPYRAYIQIAEGGESRLTFTVDGETTAIEGVAADKTMDGTIYNLNGQRVKTAKKGVYVVNGKAVIVK